MIILYIYIVRIFRLLSFRCEWWEQSISWITHFNFVDLSTLIMKFGKWILNRGIVWIESSTSSKILEVMSNLLLWRLWTLFFVFRLGTSNGNVKTRKLSKQKKFSIIILGILCETNILDVINFFMKLKSVIPQKIKRKCC